MNKYLTVTAVAIIAGYVGWTRLSEPAPNSATALASVKVPELQGNAIIGKRVFDVKCAVCHGENAAGQDGVAPPLVHIIYEPSHHGDASFLLAVRSGVRAHHWPFGPMPPVDGLTDGDVTMIVAYIRALQVENGIN